MKRQFREYKIRDRLLKTMGFESYRAYLKSELWQKVRERVFQRWGRFCLMCGEPATQVHHNSYNLGTLWGTNVQPLKPLCGKCHKNLEYNGQRKMTLPKVKETFCQIRNEVAQSVKAKSEIKRFSQLFDYE